MVFVTSSGCEFHSLGVVPMLYANGVFILIDSFIVPAAVGKLCRSSLQQEKREMSGS